MDKIFYVQQCKKWTEAVISQGIRTINCSNKMFQEMSQGIFRNKKDSIEEFIHSDMDQMVEEHFFVIALGKSCDFLKRIDEFKEISEELGIKFGNNIRDIRNMREHDDEYIAGKGYNMKSFIHEDKERSTISDATSTIVCHSQKRYMLGGRLNIYEVIDFYLDKIIYISSTADEILQKLYREDRNE